MRRFATALVSLLPSIPGKNQLLRLLGHRVSRAARLSPSVLLVSRMVIAGDARIGWFNFIRCRRLVMRQGSYLGRFNQIRGPISVHLAERGAIGNGNVIRRAEYPVTYGPSRLRLGVGSKITVGHFLDCTKSIEFGARVTVAGRGSQFWTHGYYHLPRGAGRFRVDGTILVEDDVYIGSMVLFSYGARVAEGSVIGAQVVVTKSLERGMYVNQPLRQLPLDQEAMLSKLRRVAVQGLEDSVYERR